jgi:hypothetical protein
MTAYLYRHVLPAAYDVLPHGMQSAEADAFLMAIALQESKCAYRKQIGGPAKGFWQFEAGGGVKGVLTHHASKDAARSALVALSYPHAMTVPAIHAVLEHNDVLACVFARLLLWTLPEALPGEYQADEAWRQYLAAWRPGKPHKATWARNFDRAWALK